MRLKQIPLVLLTSFIGSSGMESNFIDYYKHLTQHYHDAYFEYLNKCTKKVAEPNDVNLHIEYVDYEGKVRKTNHSPVTGYINTVRISSKKNNIPLVEKDIPQFTTTSTLDTQTTLWPGTLSAHDPLTGKKEISFQTTQGKKPIAIEQVPLHTFMSHRHKTKLIQNTELSEENTQKVIDAFLTALEDTQKIFKTDVEYLHILPSKEYEAQALPNTKRHEIAITQRMVTESDPALLYITLRHEILHFAIRMVALDKEFRTFLKDAFEKYPFLMELPFEHQALSAKLSSLPRGYTFGHPSSLSEYLTSFLNTSMDGNLQKSINTSEHAVVYRSFFQEVLKRLQKNSGNKVNTSGITFIQPR